MRSTSLYFLFLIVAFINCSDSPNHNNQTDTTNKSAADSITHHQSTTPTGDSLPKNQEELLSVTNWTTNDFIVHAKDKSSPSLRQSIEYRKEQWQNIKSPIVATYRGCDVGDYFHLNFEDADGKMYDFGFGNNTYGEYTLCDSIAIADNPEYLGKSFNIYWNWKIASFPCCDGEYEMVEAYVPSITRLELIGTTDSKK